MAQGGGGGPGGAQQARLASAGAAASQSSAQRGLLRRETAEGHCGAEGQWKRNSEGRVNLFKVDDVRAKALLFLSLRVISIQRPQSRALSIRC